MSPTNPRLWVGNLPWVAQKSEVERLFAENGIAYRNIDFSTDPFDGRNPSYCFVDFNSQHDATQALWVLPGKMLRDRPVKVNYNVRRPRESQGDALNETLIGKIRASDWRKPCALAQDRNSLPVVRNKWNTDASTTHRILAMEEGRRLFVGGLPWVPNHPALEAEMRALFRGHEVEAISKLMSPKAGDGRGQASAQFYCFVDVPNATEARKAAQSVNGRYSAFGGPHGVRVARPTPSQESVRYVREHEPRPHIAESRVELGRDLHLDWRRPVVPATSM